MLIVADAELACADLAEARLMCRCGGRLRRWGHAAPRSIRALDGTIVRLRPRRARCTGCHATHVLLPGWCLPRHGDSAQTIGAVLVAKAAGHGWRTIAAQLGRPDATVRRWLPRARGQHATWLYRQGVTHAAALHADVLNHTKPADNMLADALTALAAAVAAWRHRFADHAMPTWTLVVAFTDGRLLGDPRRRRDQQGGVEGTGLSKIDRHRENGPSSRV